MITWRIRLYRFSTVHFHSKTEINLTALKLLHITSFIHRGNSSKYLFLFLLLYSDTFRDYVPFVQFKKRENPHGGVLLLEPATLLKVTLPHGCFSLF